MLKSDMSRTAGSAFGGKKLIIAIIGAIIAVIVLALAVNLIGLCPFLNRPLNYLISGSPDKSCQQAVDCAIKPTDCGICSCGETVNKNWQQFCPFKASFISVLCKPCSVGQIQCVAGQCQQPELLPEIFDFESCAAAGNLVMESYPRQCRANGQTFVEVITKELIPADSAIPAAGICAEAGSVKLVSIQINADVPSPRCQKISAAQSLLVQNNTNQPVTLWFGQNKEYAFNLAANGQYQLPQVAGILAPGVHVLHGTPYSGSEIWLINENIANEGTVSGQILLGPTCPVQRIPPDPACADKTYQTSIQIIAVGSPLSSPFRVITSDSQGNYVVTLPVGEYNFQPQGGQMLPRCNNQDVIVTAGANLKVDFSCDTGIR